MKIGILTLPLHTNYGGILQAYALQTVLERMGHETFHIKIRNWQLQRKTLRSVFSSLVHRYTKRNISQSVSYRFIDEHIKYKDYEGFCFIQKSDFDVIVVGSDQIWNYAFVPKIENVYLDFTQTWNVKRIAYATSFGTETWNYKDDDTHKCKELLKLFSGVSVREDIAISLCEHNLGHTPFCTLDPTLLLRSDDYKKFVRPQRVYANTPKNLFAYLIVDSQGERNLLNMISKDFEIVTVISLAQKEKKEFLPSVEDWITYIANAGFVITDSFHCCVFSILFRKPFVVIASAKGVSRLYSLLRKLGLTSQIISEDATNNILHAAMQKAYEYIINEEKLEQWRKSSMHFLESYIKK